VLQFKKKLFRSQRPPVQCSVLFGGAFVAGNESFDSSKIEAVRTNDGFKIPRKFGFRAEANLADDFVAMINRTESRLPRILPLLSEAATLEEALVAPNLVLAMALLNSMEFPLKLSELLFKLFVRHDRHHFLIRALVLAEISVTPIHLIFQELTKYSKPFMILFCSVAMTWLNQLIRKLQRHPTVKPSELLEILINACGTLPPEALYLVRVLITVLLFTVNDGRAVFSVFLNLLTGLIGIASKLQHVGNSTTASMLSQLVIQLEGRGKSTNESLLDIAPFMMRLLQAVPRLCISEILPIEKIGNFMEEFSDQICGEIERMSERGESEHILVFSFAQNFRFLLNLGGDSERIPVR
jgi:hypothetical protein